jgi:hypothetical protein
VTDSTDCNDADATVNPGAAEVCDGKDNDCNGQVDEGLLGTFYADTDTDSYGDSASSTQACTAPAGYVTDSTDCNDADATVNPGAAEVLDGKDNDCDGQIDEGLLFAQVTARHVFYNSSYYDNNNVGIDPGTGAKTDSAAIDTTKSPLMVDGGVSTFANWTGYTKGLNGLIYDVEAPTVDPQASDFTFTNLTRTGATASAVSPSASSMIVLQAAGPRKVRMIFTFADNSLKNTWLQVDIGTGFGLAAAETHYWANAAGEVNIGNSATNILTDSADELAIKAHPTTSLNRSLVTDPYDITKNSTADATDQLYVRANKTSSLNCVKSITK